jgi:hypothetical protein
MRAHPDMPDLDRRAFVVGLNINIGLLGFLIWLIGSQIWSIELNYTHAELDRWSKENPDEVWPPQENKINCSPLEDGGFCLKISL